MRRMSMAVVVWLASCGAATAEDAAARPLEESIAMSRFIVAGKVTKLAVRATETGGPAAFLVEIEAVLRGNGNLKKGAVISVSAPEDREAGHEAIFFLSSADAKDGHRLHASAPAGQLEQVKKLLALEARAEKELDGKDKLRAAFFHAHKLRPVLLAAAERKALKPAGPIPEKEQAALLSALGTGLAQIEKKNATADVKAMTALLHRVLSGPGGLPEYRVRNERVAQFWNRQLNDPAQRKKHRLTKLVFGDKVDVAARAKEAKADAPVARIAAVEVIIGGVIREPLPPPRRSKAPESKPVVSGKGEPVNGIALECRADRQAYDFVDEPGATVKVTAVFRNTGTSSVRLNTYLIFPFLARVTIAGPNGQAVPHVGPGLGAAEIPAMGAESFEELKPGATMAFAEQIPASAFKANGAHTLRIVYRNKYGKRFGVNAWTGEIASAPVSIKVRKHPPPKPAAPDAPEPAPDTGDDALELGF